MWIVMASPANDEVWLLIHVELFHFTKGKPRLTSDYACRIQLAVMAMVTTSNNIWVRLSDL